MYSRIVMHLTKECNANCIHCYWNCGQKFPDEMSTAEVKHVLKELVRYSKNKPDVCLEGGEYFLREDAIEIIEIANRLGIKPRITTNGTILTKQLLNYLAQRVSSMNFSLDGTCEKTHDTIRGVSGLFEQVIDLVKYSAKLNIDTRISSVVMANNYQELIEMPTLASQIGAHRLGFYTLMPIGRVLDRAQTMGVTPHKMFSFYQKTSLVNSKQLNPLQLLFLGPFMKKERLESFVGQIHCSAGELSRCDIGPTGDIYPCGLLVGTKYTIGNVRSSKLEDVLSEPTLKNYCYNLNSNEPAECAQCVRRARCKGGCPGINSILRDNGYKVKPHCTNEFAPVCRFRDYQ